MKRLLLLVLSVAALAGATRLRAARRAEAERVAPWEVLEVESDGATEFHLVRGSSQRLFLGAVDLDAPDVDEQLRSARHVAEQRRAALQAERP
ncbi:hypothetical protein [Conexibacter sp. SYSU D00693]|uniref:hypothetical protein n=1 Tax=Conexibacter sp. SYSU D00693 TaxID=2812560 RepID=UPI00196AEF0E|nr:hypothetical protein [Conexibacter sp. SYSU D00693]